MASTKRKPKNKLKKRAIKLRSDMKQSRKEQAANGVNLNVQRKIVAVTEEPPILSNLTAWFDGCCEPRNPGGHASFGVLIKWKGDVILAESGYCGVGPNMSNNVAEFAGIIRILEYLSSRAEHCTIKGDSMLVVNLLNGKWKARGGRYVPYYKRAKELFEAVGGSDRINLSWIPRELNSECDSLSKKVLKDRGVTFKLQPE